MAYNPLVPPQTNEDLLPYLNEEFVRVAQSLNNTLEGQWEIRHQLPVRFKKGLVVYLDGKDANPLVLAKRDYIGTVPQGGSISVDQSALLAVY